MTSEASLRAAGRNRDEKARDLETLQQVVWELEGLCKLESVVPQKVIWDRPPGLPSGAELLWLVHVIDIHVFLPALVSMNSEVLEDPQKPDLASLLEAHPCPLDSLKDLALHIRESREQLVKAISSMESHPADFVAAIASHDRAILSSLTERLYESGLGA